MHSFRFPPVEVPPQAQALRIEVRQFLADEIAKGSFTPKPNCSSFGLFDPKFTKLCGERGYIGMTWPKKYGGGERSVLEHFVTMEEMQAAGAPVGAHGVADRQSGHQILRHGSERARQSLLPRIAAGECYFAIGMSEPDAGSDLAAVRTRGTRVDGGWSITGTKVWTSHSHRAHYLIALVRTEPKTEDRHAGLTQFIIDLSQSGVTLRPIYDLYGGHNFNEVVFDNYIAPDDMIVGEAGEGWKMVTGELALERSAPDRFLSTYQLLAESIRQIGQHPDDRSANEIGRFVAHLATLRRMSGSIAGMIERGDRPAVEAACVKDLGTAFEREIPDTFRHLLPSEPRIGASDAYDEMIGTAILRAPSFTIRGGTREILRGMIARGLGLR